MTNVSLMPDRLKSLLIGSNIPERFRDRTIEGFITQGENQAMAKTFAAEFVEKFDSRRGRNAILTGNVGTGKTHLACAIARGLLVAKPTRRVRYTSVQRALRGIKDTWSKDSPKSESQAIEELANPDLLILDEVGIQFGSETERSLLFDVINERYERLRSTIIISNLDLDPVKDLLGTRVFDRLREDGASHVEFGWESHRGR
jgi:DNA replication protein DnaC